MRWTRERPPEIPPLHGVEWVVAVVRVLAFLLVSLIIAILLVLARFTGRYTGRRRPGAGIIRFWGRFGLWCCGLTPEIRGEPMEHGGALVANHSTWIDILGLLAAAEVTFVSKAEVRTWPFIGPLARLGRTVFIERRQKAVRSEMALLSARIAAGDRMCFFPEGTSTDGSLVLDFRSSLFGAFHMPDHDTEIWVQPVSIGYAPPAGLPPDFYGWWGDMGFADNLLSVFGKSNGGRIRLSFHAPVKASDFTSRKTLARYCCEVVRRGHAETMAEMRSGSTGAAQDIR
ncbi:MAG: lysophospholipid acyltransferase family protein [Paracoccaceae bacterium]